MNFNAITKSRWLDLLKRTFRGWMDHRAPRLSAALAYYSIFSIAPLLVITIGLLGLVFGEQAVSGRLYGELSGYMGTASAFGAAGSVVLLLWVYYTSSIFFFGAEFTQVYADADDCVTESAVNAVNLTAGKRESPGSGSAVLCDSLNELKNDCAWLKTGTTKN
jgi:uncharacterized BrkB/YihY/UPF0761 family membrane protein